ncbi:MAG: prephenate dehydrogenase [bacterium]|nr:prephenate dehydrogenase [bacterium]
MIRTIGVIGMGEFGRLIVRFMPKDVEVLASSRRDIKIKGAKMVSLDTIAKADVIVLATPFDSIEGLLKKLKPIISKETLLVDVTSVKTKVEKVFAKVLPEHKNVLLTHPLFGPQSTKDGLFGQTFVVTKQAGDRANEVMKWVKAQGMIIEKMTGDEHDIVMAEVHALTFFIGRGLSDIGIKDQPLKTPSFESVLRLIFLDKSHSQDLFETIEKQNPYAKQKRRQFLDALTNIHNNLEN